MYTYTPSASPVPLKAKRMKLNTGSYLEGGGGGISTLLLLSVASHLLNILGFETRSRDWRLFLVILVRDICY